MWQALVAKGISDAVNLGSQYYQNKQDAKMQYDFAQNGIQWRVADAKKAGIHPLAALGAQTMSPYLSGTAPQVSDPSAIVERALSGENRLKQAQAKNMELQNTLLGIQINDLRKNVEVNFIGDGQYPGLTTLDPGQNNGNLPKDAPARDWGINNHSEFFQYSSVLDEVWLTPNKENMEIIQDFNPHVFEYFNKWKDILQLDNKLIEDPSSPGSKKWAKLIRVIRPSEPGFTFEYMGGLRWKKVKTNGKKIHNNFFANGVSKKIVPYKQNLADIAGY